MFDINDKNKMFAYVPSKSDLTVDNINLYSNSLIFIGDEKQIYQPLTNTYIGIGKTAYNNLFNEFKEKIDKLYIHSLSNSNNTHYFPILKTTGTGSFYYTYLSNRIGVNPDKQLFIGNLSGTSYTSSYSYIYPNSNNENLPLIFANNTNNINNTIYKDSDNSIYYNPSKNSFGHGSNVVASGDFSTAEGYETTAYGLYSHAEGDRSFAIGVSSHTEGLGNVSYDDHTHTEGVSNIAYGNSSHVEGYGNISYKDYSHVEGLYNINKGRVSHVGGEYSVAYSENSLVHGRGLISNNLFEISFGRYNISNHDTKFSIGNGTADQRSNLFEIRENGCAYAKTFVGNLNGRARWADHATYSTYTTYTTYSLYNSYQSIHQSSLNANHYITFAQNTTYSLSYIDTDLYYNPSTNILYSNKFTGNLTGNVTGNLTGDVTGNASTATKLQTARKINGVSFDGSSDITLSPLSLPINGNNIAVTVGNQTSQYITVPYATNSNLAAKATILETARKINGVSFNGSADITIAPSMYIFDKTIGIEVGNQQSATITVPYATVSGSTTGNAATADKWKTAIPIQIGDTSKNVDGSAGVSWTLNEIGVYSKATANDTFVYTAGDTMSGTLTLKGSTSNVMTFAGNVHPALRFDNSDSSQNVAFIFTDNDNYRSPAGIKLIGNQGSEWFEVAGEMYAAGGKKVLHANNYFDYTVKKDGTGATGTWSINVTGNAGTATKLQTARKINGVSFDGSADITLSPLSLPINGNTIAVTVGNQTSNYITVPYATNANLAAKATILETARKINGVSFNGSADITIAPSMYIFDKTIGIEVGNQQSSTITVPYATVSGSTTGNAATADKWKTARAFKIGDTSKNVDGSAAVTWTLDEIGVYSKSTSDSRYVNATGDTMTGALTIKGVTDTGQISQGGFNKAYANIILQGDNTYGVSGIVFKSMKANDTSINSPGDVAFIQYHPMGVTAAAYNNTPTQATSGERSRLVIGIGNDADNGSSSAGEELWLQTAGANDLKHYVVNTGYIILDANNYTNYTVTKTGSGASGTWGINITGNAATADKWKTARAIKIGDTSKNVDGSAGVTWTLDEIGVYSKSTSDNRYVNVDGDTMTGALTFTKLIYNWPSSTAAAMIVLKSAENYGIWYHEGDPDKMMFSASGNANNASNADFAINGAGDGTLTCRGNIILHAGNYTTYTVTKTGSGASGTWGINISGNAATADKWKTARAIKIGDTSKNVDGSAGVTWTLDEIGVYSKATSDSRYVNVDGDTMTGHLKMGGTVNLGSAWDKGIIAGADGHTKVVLTYLASSTNGAVIGAHNSALSAWDILNIAGTQLIFRINETEKMRLNASGYLGIGTSSPSYPLHVNGNAYASGFIKNGSNINYVLTGDGGHKQWTTSNTANALVARDGNGYVYATYYNSNIGDENNITIGSVYVRNNSDNWIRRMSLSSFVSKINEDDTKTITKSLKVTEAWMDTGITTEGGNFPKGNGTYIVQISHSHLDSGNDGYASIYSGIMTIYTGTNATDQTEEVILHRSGHASAKRLYLRTITTASSAAYCKIQIAAATAWGKAANVTFKFRKMI